MIILPFLHFFCFIANTFLAFFVLYKNPKSLLNITCSILMLCFAFWNLGDIIVQNPDSSITKGTVVIMQNIASIGWLGFASAIFCFSIAFSKREKLLKKKWFLFFVIILPLFFVYKQWTNCLTINPIRQSYGWSYSWTDTIWTFLFYVYYSLFTLLSLYFIYFYGRKTKNIYEKKQANIITFSVISSLIIGTIFDVVIPELGIQTIPSLGNIFIFIFAIGLFYAIVKHRFLIITPAIAAENIISAMDEFLILLNQEGNILTANKATLVSLQYEQNELEGKPITILFQDHNFKKKLLEEITNEEVIKNRDFNFLTKAGETISIIYSCSPLKDKEGIIIGTVFIARDITKHIQLENELILAKEHAEESDRLKSAFLANMSHEIRTPMNGILGFSELLKDPGLTGEKQQEYIRIIEKSGARMLNIINDIIDFSKIEAGLMNVNITKVDINEKIESIYIFFKPQVEEKGMQFSFKNTLPTKEATIRTDSEKVDSILTNLVKNAIKYSDKGAIEFGYIKKDETLEFYVKDTGIGIPMDRRSAIFERFIQADITDKKAFQGAGLGLSISKSYVEMLGGKIWVECEEGIGSTFYFTLPYNAVPEEKKIVGKAVSIKDKKNEIKNLKVLIVEDEEASEMLLSITAKEFSKEVIKASTGNEAIEICRTNPDLDLILMDIQMPVLNGYETTRQIRQFNKGVVIIAQTAFGLSGDRVEAIEAGCNDYFTKPFKKDELLSLIHKYFKK